MAELRITNLTAEVGTAPTSVTLDYDIGGDVPQGARLVYTVAITAGEKVLTSANVDAPLAATPAPSTPTTPTTPPAPPAAGVAVVTNLQAKATGAGKVLIFWDITLPAGAGGSAAGGQAPQVRVERDGKDASGYGPWGTSIPATQKSFEFTLLKGPYTFTVTPAGGKAVTVVGDPATNPPAQPTQPTQPSQPTQPTQPSTPPGPGAGPGNGTFKAMTVGAAVYYAADGGFNAAFGKRHGLYSTWGANGKVWAIDTPSSEYGANSVARLGEYDLDIAPQRLLTNGWGGAASGSDDGNWRSDITELKAKWGDRRGHVYYRPFHEFNGDWYQWSLRNTGDQENFKKAWGRLRKIWDDVMQGDKRFHLEWSPNRDSKYGLNLANAYPDGIPDVIGPDYYDFALRLGSSSAQAEEEKKRTQNGGGPVGIIAYLDFAKSKGVPVLFPEWGVQFGDNVTFLQMVLPVFDAYRYTGSGDPAGKILGMAWHNLQGSSPDPNAGGDFAIVKGNAGYSGRPNSFKMMRDWIQKSTWLRTV